VHHAVPLLFILEDVSFQSFLLLPSRVKVLVLFLGYRCAVDFRADVASLPLQTPHFFGELLDCEVLHYRDTPLVWVDERIYVHLKQLYLHLIAPNSSGMLECLVVRLGIIDYLPAAHDLLILHAEYLVRDLYIQHALLLQFQLVYRQSLLQQLLLFPETSFVLHQVLLSLFNAAVWTLAHVRSRPTGQAAAPCR